METTWKTVAGNDIKVLSTASLPGMLANLDQLDLTGGSVAAGAGTILTRGKLLEWHSTGGPGTEIVSGGNADDWARSQQAAGYAVLVSDLEDAPDGFYRVVAPAQGGEGALFATRDPAVAAGLCANDPSAVVVFEPSGGWAAPGASEATTAVPEWALYLGGASVAGALVYLLVRSIGKG